MRATTSIDSLLTPEKDAAQRAKAQDQMLVVGSATKFTCKEIKIESTNYTLNILFLYI